MIRIATGVFVAGLLAASFALPVQAHHSFSIFDSSKTRVFTGVVVRVNPDVNHLQIFFAVMNEERKNVIRGGARRGPSRTRSCGPSFSASGTSITRCMGRGRCGSTWGARISGPLAVGCGG